jgi:glycosyltransferase involved in cell wall biosynthesis
MNPHAAPSAPLVSIIIPTHNRRQLLEDCLRSLGRQIEVTGRFEVIVADDGSSDRTVEFLASLDGSFSYPLQCIALPKRGAASARNHAIEKARAPRVLLLGDDTLPAENLLAAHLEAAASRPDIAVQGRIEWHPEESVTPVMRFLAPEGPQFYFKGLRHGQPIPYTVVYGSNLSAPTRWFREDPFDEGFPAAAFEDTELAFRWRRKGRTTIYWEKALCLHRHRYSSIGDYLDRQFIAGRAARRAIRLHPGMALRTLLTPLAVGVAHACRYGIDRMTGHAKAEGRWDLQCRLAFLKGFVASDSDAL